MKDRLIQGFGTRLARIRKSRGLTQAEPGNLVGTSKRMVVYYEKDEAQPPGAILIDLAKVLEVSTDELLGLNQDNKYPDPKEAKLIKKLMRTKSCCRSTSCSEVCRCLS